jgi:hypothetical protein
MLSAARKFFAAGLVLVAALLLTGCDDTARYSVKAYSLGNSIGEYQARSLSVDNVGTASFVLAEGGRSVVVSNGYAMRRTDITTPSSSPLVFHGMLYSGGKEVDAFDASSITSYRDRVSLEINNSQRAVFSGTYVVHHIGANIAGTPDTARYKVTLHNDGAVVGTWFADSHSTSQGGGLVLKINGIDNALIIGGQYQIQQIR